jgi:hypothetical protein
MATTATKAAKHLSVGAKVGISIGVISVVALAVGLPLGLTCNFSCSPDNIDCGKSCKRLSHCKGKKCSKGNECKDNACVAPAPTPGYYYTCDGSNNPQGCSQKEGVTTGWETADQCKCFKCDASKGQCAKLADNATGGDFNTNAECTDPSTGCRSKLKYECVTTGGGDKACVQSDTGTYNSPDECKCWKCDSGTCKAQPKGDDSYYKTAALCDTGAKCGWTWDCDANATDSDYLCKQVKNGQFESEDKCMCRKCSDATGGPTSTCDFTATHGVFGTLADCESNPDAKCTWMYKCPS